MESHVRWNWFLKGCQVGLDNSKEMGIEIGFGHTVDSDNNWLHLAGCLFVLVCAVVRYPG